MNEYETYIDTIDEIENRVEDDSKFPVVENGRIKMSFQIIFEFTKIPINYLMNFNIHDVTKKKT